MRRVVFGICLLLLQACGGLQNVASDGEASNLVLNNSESILSFVSIKNDAIGEVHRFNALSGFLTENDQVNIDIDLSSVSTGIEIRDQRMGEHLFQLSVFSKATIAVSISDFDLNDLAPGDSANTSVSADVDLHGVTQSLQADVTINRLANGALQVKSTNPIILNASAFGLTPGINKLAELAALKSIATAVPVSFNLLFERV